MICLPFLYVLFAVFVLLVLFCIVPFKFGAYYLKTANKQKLYIYVSIFGILLRIPIRNSEKKPDKSKKRIPKKRKEKDSETSFTFQTFRENVDTLFEVFQACKKELSDMLSYVRNHLSCQEMDFRIAFGMGDAAKTGITTGAVWTSGTMLLKVIDSFIGIEKVHMDVYPDFNNKRFEISTKAILVMRPIHFIFIYNKISKTIKFIKTKISNL